MDSKILDDFFIENYDNMKKFVKSYMFIYNYRLQSVNDFIAEYYIFIKNKENRLKFYTKIIESGRGKNYLYSTMMRTIEKYTTFTNNCNKIKDILLNYYNFYDDTEIKIEEYDLDIDIEHDSVLNISLKLKDKYPSNYFAWYDKRIMLMTYKRMSVKYNLTITPLRQMVIKFDKLIIKEMNNND